MLCKQYLFIYKFIYPSNLYIGNSGLEIFLEIHPIIKPIKNTQPLCQHLYDKWLFISSSLIRQESNYLIQLPEQNPKAPQIG